MTEADARAAVELIVGRTAIQLLDRFAALLLAENDRQNLIARSTVPVIWQRHMLDSAQLLRWSASDGLWIDIGTGGGFPGIVIAIARVGPMMLVEPRPKRAAFLSNVVADLGLGHASVVVDRIERMPAVKAAAISARAVAPIGKVFADAERHATIDTTWLLPRGSGWSGDVERATHQWKGAFHVEQSLSDPAASVVIATKVSRR